MTDQQTARLRTLADLVLRQAWASEALARTLAKECGRTVRDLEALLKGWELEDHPDGPLFGGLSASRTEIRDELAKAGIDPDVAARQVREKVQEATGVVLGALAPPIATAPSGGGKPLRRFTVHDRRRPDTPLGEVQGPSRNAAHTEALNRWPAVMASEITLTEVFPPSRRQAQQRGTVEVVREWWVYRGDTTDRVGTVNATTEPAALALAIDLHGPDVWVCPAGESPAPSEPPQFTNVIPRGVLKCGAVVGGEPGHPSITKVVNGVTYYAIPTTTERRQFPPCPKPTCRALIPCADDLPGGEYQCLCRSCRVLVLRDANGLIRLELADAPAAPVPADDPAAIAAAMLDLARASMAKGLQVIPAPSALEPVPITTGEKAAWEDVATECPAGLDRFVHQAGEYVHGLAKGKVVCLHHINDSWPAGWQPSPAQVAAWKAAREPSPPVSQPEPGGPMDLRHVSWDATCTFFVLLDNHRPVECTWHPDHAHAQGCGEPGRLEMRGPVSAESFRAIPIPLAQRTEPLAEVARRRAQEAHDAEQMRVASPGKVKEPRKKRKKAEAAGKEGAE